MNWSTRPCLPDETVSGFVLGSRRTWFKHPHVCTHLSDLTKSNQIWISWFYFQSDGIYSWGWKASIFLLLLFPKATLFSGPGGQKRWGYRQHRAGAAGWATPLSVQERVSIRLTCRALQPWATLGLQEPGGWLRRSQRPQKPCEKGVNESLDFSGWLRWLLLIFFEFRCVISVHTLGITGRWVHIFLIEPDGRQHCDKIWGKMWLCKKALVSACGMCPHVPWDLKGTCQRVLSWEETQGDRHECFVSLCTGRSVLLFTILGHQKSLLICPTIISWSGKSTCF